MSPHCSEERRALLAVARRAIVEATRGERPARIPHRRDPDSALVAAPGVFVTLRYRGRLRGCVGQIETVETMGEVVAHCAVAAARDDPRFEPVEESEVGELEIEISLLSALESMAANEIEIGRHGLVVQRGSRRGLLLPQVAVEQRWQWQRFVEETCAKAGLSRDAWKDPATRTFAFTTEVVSEAASE
jgi:AmmeMemoRadiSam system protein A